MPRPPSFTFLKVEFKFDERQLALILKQSASNADTVSDGLRAIALAIASLSPKQITVGRVTVRQRKP